MTVHLYRFMEVGIFSMINLMPFLLMAIYPFRRHLRFSKAVTATLLVGVTLIQISLGYFAAASSLSSGIISLISTVFYVIFYFFVIKDHIGRSGFVLLCFSNLGFLVSVCAKYLESLIFGSTTLESYCRSLPVCMIIMHALITLPLAFYVRKYFNSSIPIQNKSWNFLWIVPATFHLIWHYHLHFATQDNLLAALDEHHVLFLVFINLGVFAVYHTATLLLIEQQKNAELTQNNYLLSLHSIQHENLQHRINEARRAKHDVHHHTHLIREYLRAGKLQELEAYLDQYSASLPDAQSLVYCPHYETNTLLGYFVHQARQHGINVDVFVQFPETLHLPQTTLSVLFGNLMENAITACDTVTSGEKNITVRGKSSCGFIYLDISNNYSGTLKKNQNGEYFSTKTGGHGLGLSSVAHLANSHNGILEIDDKNNIFRVSVMLQEQREN